MDTTPMTCIYCMCPDTTGDCGDSHIARDYSEPTSTDESPDDLVYCPKCGAVLDTWDFRVNNIDMQIRVCYSCAWQSDEYPINPQIDQN